MNIFLKKDILFYLTLLTLGICAFFVAIIWPEQGGFSIATLIATFVGFCVSAYIFYAKRFKDQVACPSGGDCNVVVKSKYAQFLGIPLEYMGMAYYLIIFVLYVSFLCNSMFKETFLLPLALGLTVCAFLFSLYLLFVQGFLLRRWCIWCLLSAAASIIIFILSLTSYTHAAAFLIGVEPILVILKSFGYVLGMGGSSAAVFLFLKFLEDMDISGVEASALRGIAEMVWCGLGLVLVSEFARYIAYPEILGGSSTFVLEVAALIIVFLSGAVLLVLCAPFLDMLSFEKKESSPLSRMRQATMAAGAVALSSWYVAFVSNYIPEYSLTTLILVYIIVVSVAILVSSIWQMRMGD